MILHHTSTSYLKYEGETFVRLETIANLHSSVTWHRTSLKIHGGLKQLVLEHGDMIDDKPTAHALEVEFQQHYRSIGIRPVTSDNSPEP